MNTLLKKLDFRRFRIMNNRQKAQGMVEFALILPLLLLIVLGLIEVGRMIFMYSSVSLASREAARYGAAVGNSGGVPFYADCDGIENEAIQTGFFAGIEPAGITINYDRGAAGTGDDYATCDTLDPDDVELADRIIVSVQADYQVIVPLVPIPAFTMSSTTARTIIKEVGIRGTPLPTDTPYAGVYPAIQAQKVDSLAVDADSNGVPSPGDTLLYLITVSNVGYAPATNVVFEDTPDSNTALVVDSVATSRGTVTEGNGSGDTSVTVSIGVLGGSSSATISFEVTIDDPLPDGVTQVSNQGVVSSSELSDVQTDDPAVDGDSNPTITTVQPTADTPTPTPTPTSTATATATPTPTVTNTPGAPTATPTPVCPSPGGLTVDQKKVEFTINNPLVGYTYNITNITINWPNGQLKTITFSSMTLSPNDNPPDYSVDPNWTGTFANPEKMTFLFQNPVNSPISVRVTFEGCAPISGNYP